MKSEIERGGRKYLVSTVELERERWHTAVFPDCDIWQSTAWEAIAHSFSEANDNHAYAVMTWKP